MKFIGCFWILEDLKFWALTMRRWTFFISELTWSKVDPLGFSFATAKGRLRIQLAWISVIASSITASSIRKSWIKCDIAFSMAPAWVEDEASVGDFIREFSRPNMEDGRQSPNQESVESSRGGMDLGIRRLATSFGRVLFEAREYWAWNRFSCLSIRSSRTLSCFSRRADL